MVFVYTGVFSEYNIIIHYNSVKKYIERIFKNIGIGDLLMAIRHVPACSDDRCVHRPNSSSNN